MSAMRSTTMPSSIVAGTATIPASTNDPVALNVAAAKYAPIMYSDPCARFTKFMIPNTRVSPAAIRNSRMPSCRPFSACVRKRPTVILFLPHALLQRALRVVRVLVVLERRPDGLQADAALGILRDLEDVLILDREA